MIVTKKLFCLSILFICIAPYSCGTQLMIIRNATFHASTIIDQYNGSMTQSSCICRCYQNSQCITMNYDGENQTCTLFSTSIKQGELRTMNSNMHHVVISFSNRTVDEITNMDPSTSSSTVTTVLSTTLSIVGTRCSPQNITLFSFTTSPTTYQRRTYNYTASFTSMLTLEFGFQAKNSAKTWHLDDVSVLHLNSSNITEMLINGNFENGTLIGWQRSCTSMNCGGSTGGSIVQVSCRTGSYCYEGACQDDYDFLRQSFLAEMGHVYMLSFWLFTDGHAAQKAYVTMN